MAVRADETHLRYSSQCQIIASEYFAIQGFSPGFRAQSHSRTLKKPQAFAPCGQPGKTFDPPTRGFKRLIQTGMRVESDVLFRLKNNQAVAVLRQRGRPSVAGQFA